MAWQDDPVVQSAGWQNDPVVQPANEPWRNDPIVDSTSSDIPTLEPQVVSPPSFVDRIKELARTPSPEWMRPAEEWMRKPLLQPMTREERTRALGYDPGPLPEEYLPEGPAKEVVGGLREAGGEFVQSLSSPAMIALTLASGGSAAGGRIAAGAFAAQMASQTPELWQQFNDAETLRDKVRIAGQAALTIGGAALGARHAFKLGPEIPSRAEPVPPELPELPPSPSLGPGTLAADVTKALEGPGWERRFQLVPEPKAQVEPAPSLAETIAQLPEGRFGTETPEGFVPQGRTGVVPPSETANIADLIRQQTEPPMEIPSRAEPTVAEAIQQIGQEPVSNVAEAVRNVLQGQAPAPTAETPALEIPPEDLQYAGTTPRLPGEGLNAPTDIRPVPEGLPTGEVAGAEQQRSQEGGGGGISIKNEYTDTKRQELGFPDAVQEARRDFGTVWNEAEATDRQDPGAKGRLVESINEGRVKAVDDHGDALLLREQIRAQGERNDAADAVNNALTDADKTVAKARLEKARDDLQAVYDADRKAGRSTAQGLNARKMLAAEDYSLARMEARKRAANNGERLSEEQLKHTEALHAEITEVSNGLNGLEQLRREGKAGAKSGKRFKDVMAEQAQKARERLIAKRGRLNAGIDPTNLVDEAIIGASHIANGLTKFADWSAQMVRDFGDRIKPFLKDLWDRARTYHDATKKASRSPEEIRLERYKTGLAKQTVGVTAKIQRGDFTKPTRQQLVLDKAAYKMKGNLQRLKNEFERGVAKDAYNKMSPGDKFWQHFVGVERAMKLSGPGVFEKLGLAAAVREVLAPVEAGVGWGVSKAFPKLAEGTRYGADLRTIARAEIKAKAALFTEGMKDAAENLKGKETGLEAVSDKYGRQPDFWYNRIGKFHAAVKAPVKRAEFVRSLEHRMDAAAKAGEDINHPEVMDRLATESALDANRAIFQQNTVVSHFFSMLDKAHPAAGRTARFLFPITKIPVNLFKEFVTYNVGAPAAALKIGHAYWRGIETLEPAAREAIIRQLVKGSAGGAAILWGYYNNEKVHDFFASVPPWFEHTPIAMAIHEGSIIKGLEEEGTGTKYRPTESWKQATKMAKYDIPFAYTVTGLTGAFDPSNPNGWRDYLYSMIQSSVVPQVSSWTAKELDKPTPFNMFDKPTYRPPTNIVEAITQGIPGLRQDVPEYHRKRR